MPPSESVVGEPVRAVPASALHNACARHGRHCLNLRHLNRPLRSEQTGRVSTGRAADPPAHALAAPARANNRHALSGGPREALEKPSPPREAIEPLTVQPNLYRPPRGSPAAATGRDATASQPQGTPRDARRENPTHSCRDSLENAVPQREPKHHEPTRSPSSTTRGTPRRPENPSGATRNLDGDAPAPKTPKQPPRSPRESTCSQTSAAP